ncbi:Adaptive-response sensory-kinase SasA [Halomonadaceae bacterium LMG 33818]|uniref:sensor histidine kinase n=1 Tax=Cernens ardua TaxID=3402176 RepID=UPI003EDC22A2
MISLTRRLGLGLLIAGLAVMLLLAHGSVLLFDHAIRGYLGERLQDAAVGVTTELLDTQSDHYAGVIPFMDAYNRVYSGYYYCIRIDGHREIRSRSLWDQRLPILGYGLSHKLHPGPEKQQLLVWRGKFTRHGHQIDVTTALDYTAVSARLNWLRMSIWLLGGAMALLLVFVQQQVIRIGLRPLQRVRQELTQLNDGSRMKIETRVPEEIAPVVSELNHQLERIEHVVNRSRDGTSNLGHALKTPIAVMEAVIARRELDALPEIRTTLSERLNEIHRLVERELQRARLDTRDSSSKTKFKPDDALPELLTTLQELYPHITFNHFLNNIPSTLPWEHEDMLEVLGNLIDNAGKWAHSRVVIRLCDHRDHLTIEVEDDGPGIPQAQREGVLNRGTRLDERVAGHGLGLGIVEQVISYYQGQLVLDDSELGGLKVVVSLPY